VLLLLWFLDKPTRHYCWQGLLIKGCALAAGPIETLKHVYCVLRTRSAMFVECVQCMLYLQCD
jgi:hypothetical protein